MQLVLQILFILFLILVNGFFVMSEFALVSLRKTRVEELARDGNKQAKKVLIALTELPLYISATQFGITIVSLAMGWIGEPVFATVFSLFFSAYVPSHIAFFSSHIVAILLAFILITFLQIVFGELAPKTTALQNPEEFAFFIITPLSFFLHMFRPFIWMLQLSAGGITKFLGFSPKVEQPVHTEDEIKLILAQSAKKGEIDQHEAEMIYQVFRIGDMPITKIMIEKNDVDAFTDTIGVIELSQKLTEENQHVRFPIFHQTLEKVIGYITLVDLYLLSKEIAEDVAIKDTELIHPTVFVPEKMCIDDVLSLMKQAEVRLAVVGTPKQMKGIVSIEDVVESVVGEIREKEND